MEVFIVKLLSRLSIKSKIILVSTVMVILFIAFGLFMYSFIHPLKDYSERLYNIPLMLSNDALECKINILRIESSMKTAIYSNDKYVIGQVVNNIRVIDHDIRVSLDSMEKRIASTEGKQLIEESKELFEKWSSSSNEVLGLILNEEKEKALEIYETNDVKNREELKDKVYEIKEFELKKASETIEYNSNTINQYEMMLILFIFVFAFIAAFLNYIMFISIKNPLVRFYSNISDISITGKLIHIQTDGNIELKNIADKFNILIDNIKDQKWVREGINSLSNELRGHQPVESICKRSILFISKYISSLKGIIYVYDRGKDELRMASTFAYDETDLQYKIFKLGEGLVGQALSERQPLFLTLKKDNNSISDIDIISKAFYPLIYEDSSLGVMEIDIQNAFDDLQLRFLKEAILVLSSYLYNSVRSEQIEMSLIELQKVKNERELAYAELKESNEKLASSNEEFEAMNEELLVSNQELMEVNESLEKANNELKELRNKLQASDTIVKNFPNGAVILYDKDLRYIVVNGKALEEVNLDPNSMIGKTIWEIFSKEICDMIEPYYRKALEGIFCDVEVEFRDHYYRQYTIPIMNEDNVVTLGMVMTQDITLHKKMRAELERTNQLRQVAYEDLERQNKELDVMNKELQRINIERKKAYEQNEELKEMNDRLERINDEKTKAFEEMKLLKNELAISNAYKLKFLANMSHELRTPLNSIIALSKLMIDDTNKIVTEEYTKMLSVINQSGNDLLDLINDILDLSKVELGKASLNISEVNLNTLFDTVKYMFNHLAEEQKLDFNIECDDNLIIVTDREKFLQILKNLLSNAFKFTNEGSVTLKAKRIEGLNEPIIISVIDTGIGISEENQGLIFKSFYQIDNTNTRKYKGTGLGLSISKGLVELLGGKIVFESKLGIGSTFTILLPEKLAIEEKNVIAKDDINKKPIIYNNQDIEPLDNQMSTHRLDGKKLLLIGNNAESLFRECIEIEKFGADTFKTISESKAFQIMEKETINLVLVDAERGFDFSMVDNISIKTAISSIPIIVLNGDSEFNCIKPYVSECLMKPVDIDVLMGAIFRNINRKN